MSRLENIPVRNIRYKAKQSLSRLQVPLFGGEAHAEANFSYLGRRNLTLSRKHSDFAQFVDEHLFIPHLQY